MFLDASLSEHFYQLRLVPSLSIPTPRLSSLEPPARSVLSRRQRWGLLFFLVRRGTAVICDTLC
jgi:peroxin-12